MSAQETFFGHSSSTADFRNSTASNPKSVRLGGASLSALSPGVLAPGLEDSSTEPSAPETIASCDHRRRRAGKLTGSFSATMSMALLMMSMRVGQSIS
ncbi:hypothetical protein Mapa_016699 [Marchantia paleacea]|nr:hypothetical protein Mapa_016699 [Marchantia paleacea]